MKTSITLHGNRVLIERPILKKSTLELTEAMEKEMELEMISKYTKLKIAALGDTVNEIKPNMAVGDLVYVDPNYLMSSKSTIIDETPYMIIDLHNILFSWK